MRSKSSVLIQKNRKQNRKRKFLRKIIILSILIVVLISGLIVVARNSHFLLQKINISGNKIIETERIRDEVNKILDSNFLFIFPKKNVLWFPKEKIKENILKSYSRIRKVEIERRSFKEIEVMIEEYGSKYLACVPAPIETDEKCYFLDEDGHVFTEAPFFSGGVYFKFFDYLEGKDIAVGDDILPPPEFKRIISLIDQLSNLGLETKSMNIRKSSYELVLENKKTRIIFTKENDYNKLLSNLSAALSSKPFVGDIKKILNSLEYFDLRFGNKVYYKFESSHS